jgi:hypothetical protein
MSWSLDVPKTAAADFPAAIDAAQPYGQTGERVDEDVAAVKETLKRFAARSASPVLSASAGGHVIQPGEGDIGGANATLYANVYAFEAES